MNNGGNSEQASALRGVVRNEEMMMDVLQIRMVPESMDEDSSRHSSS